MRARDESIGGAVIERWGHNLAAGTDVLEIACGGGVPVTRTLLDLGLNVWAMDGSPTLVAEFRARFPKVPVQCARVQECDFFEREFGAVVAVGLLFLLSEKEQLALIRRVSALLSPGGRFLFTAPVETGTWQDLTTGQESLSLGLEKYRQALQQSGFLLKDQHVDEANANYYDAERATEPTSSGEG